MNDEIRDARRGGASVGQSADQKWSRRVFRLLMSEEMSAPEPGLRRLGMYLSQYGDQWEVVYRVASELRAGLGLPPAAADAEVRATVGRTNPDDGLPGESNGCGISTPFRERDENSQRTVEPWWLAVGQDR